MSTKNNYIYLYSIPWVFGGVRNPYFISDIARDNYLASLTYKQANHDGVNIKVGKNYEINLKVNLDVTELKSYNFAVIQYNDVKYYCNIIDFEHISIGYSFLYCEQNILFEKTDYLSYFKNFQISQITYANPAFDRSRSIKVNDLRLYENTVRIIPATINSREFEYVPCLVACSSIKYAIQSPWTDFNQHIHFENHNIPTNYTVACYPLVYGATINGGGGQTYISSKDGAVSFFDGTSPYTLSLFFAYLPFYKETNGSYTCCFPFQNCAYQYSSDLPNSVFTVIKNFDITVDFELSALSTDAKYGYTRLYVYGLNSYVDIQWKDFFKETNPSILTGQISYTVDVTEMTCCLKILSNNLYNIQQYVLNTFPLVNNISYVVNEKYKWLAENQYYIQLTKSYNNQKVANGAIQAATEFATGGIGLGLGLGDLATGNVVSYGANLANGVNNIIRGIGTSIQTATDSKYFKQQRELIAKQEQAKPSQATNGKDAWASSFFIEGQIKAIDYMPLDSDRYAQQAYERIYGNDCVLFYPSIDVPNASITEFDHHIVMGSFSITAIAEKNSKHLTTLEYNNLYALLKGGVVYDIIGE